MAERSSRISFYAIADTHGKPFPAKWMPPFPANSNPDAVLHLGDFSDFGRVAEPFFETWRPTNIPIHFVSGNHDSHDLCKDIESDYGAACLDYKWARIGDVLLVGFAGYDIFDTTRKQNLLRFSRRLREERILDGAQFSILLTHEPPWPWPYERRTRGDMNITEILREHRFDLVLAGHWHERHSIIRRDSLPVAVVNPGIEGSKLEIDPERKIMERF